MMTATVKCDFVQRAEGLAAEGNEHGAELFALGGEGVLGEGGDLGFKALRLRHQLPGHALQKRLHRIRDLFPPGGRLRWSPMDTATHWCQQPTSSVI